jgi:uncharacterized protein
MATSYRRPGAYVEEVTLPQNVAVLGQEEALGAFVGAALRGPVDKPVFVGSWTEFTRRFGSFRSADGTDTFRLALAVYAFFSNGGRGAYIQRVCGTGFDNATVTVKDAPTAGVDVLTVEAIDPGDWAVGSLYIQISDVNGTGAAGASANGDTFTLTVFNGGATVGYVVERWTDLSLDSGSARYALDVINGNSAYITAIRPGAATGTKPPVENDVPVALAKPGGVSSSLDGAAVAEADLKAAADKFDIVPNNLIFNVPDAYDQADAAAANIHNEFILKAEERGDSFVVVDVPKSSEATASAALTWAASVTGSNNAAVYFPSIKVVNPIPGAAGRLVTVAPGGSVAGVYHRVDASRGVFRTPGGVGVGNIQNAVDVAIRLTPAELDDLNTAAKPVNAIKVIPGNGIVIMGGRTNGGQRPNKYVAARRTLLSVKKSLVDRTQFAILENNDYLLWERVTTVCNAYLQGLYQAGGLKGRSASEAFYVKCDDTNNTAQSVADGVLNIEVGVALQTPAEFVVIRIGQFEGGSSVVEQSA